MNIDKAWRQFGRAADLALALGAQQRATRHPDGVTPESVTTHTVMLGLFVVAIAPELGLDLGRALSYVLVHDLPEALVGDTDTLGISPKAAAEKAEREAEAIASLLGDPTLAEPVQAALCGYEAAAPGDLEAQVVGYLDKCLPKFTHMLNNCDMLMERGMTTTGLLATLDAQRLKLRTRYPLAAPALEPLFDAAAEAVVARLRARRAW